MTTFSKRYSTDLWQYRHVKLLIYKKAVISSKAIFINLNNNNMGNKEENLVELIKDDTQQLQSVETANKSITPDDMVRESLVKLQEYGDLVTDDFGQIYTKEKYIFYVYYECDNERYNHFIYTCTRGAAIGTIRFRTYIYLWSNLEQDQIDAIHLTNIEYMYNKMMDIEGKTLPVLEVRTDKVKEKVKWIMPDEWETVPIEPNKKERNDELLHQYTLQWAQKLKERAEMELPWMYFRDLTVSYDVLQKFGSSNACFLLYLRILERTKYMKSFPTKKRGRPKQVKHQKSHVHVLDIDVDDYASKLGDCNQGDHIILLQKEKKGTTLVYSLLTIYNSSSTMILYDPAQMLENCELVTHLETQFNNFVIVNSSTLLNTLDDEDISFQSGVELLPLHLT